MVAVARADVGGGHGEGKHFGLFLFVLGRKCYLRRVIFIFSILTESSKSKTFVTSTGHSSPHLHVPSFRR